MIRPAAPRRDERGALSSNAAAAAAVVVLAALVYYALTGGPGGTSSQSSGTPSATATFTSSSTTATPTPTPTPTTATTTPSVEPTATRPVIDRSSYRVGVYNNSTVAGLASSTAKKVRKLGWNVVTVDNWSGSIPTTTVYYPPGSRAAAKLLAADLGLKRVHRATAAMPARALSLILTGPLP
jgi:hypothetical protein